MKEHYKGIGHIAIYTVDMDQSIAFYEMIGGSVFKRDGVETPEGLKKLALVEFGGFLLELIEPPAGTLVPSGEGSIPHFAVYVDDRLEQMPVHITDSLCNTVAACGALGGLIQQEQAQQSVDQL